MSIVHYTHPHLGSVTPVSRTDQCGDTVSFRGPSIHLPPFYSQTPRSTRRGCRRLQESDVGPFPFVKEIQDWREGPCKGGNGCVP